MKKSKKLITFISIFISFFTGSPLITFAQENSFISILENQMHENLNKIEKRQKEYCLMLGGAWDNNKKICNLPRNFEKTCYRMGGKWINNICHFPGKCISQ